jgi:uncharacterized protein (DUF433 family)
MAAVHRRRPRAEVPLYSIAEAARYSRTRPPTLRRWVLGYEGGDGTVYPPLIWLPKERPGGEPALSWENLVEAALFSHWRRKRLSLQKLRRAHELAMTHFGSHPFARHDVYTDGFDLFVEADREIEDDAHSGLLTVVSSGDQAHQVLAPTIMASLSRFDWQKQTEAPYQWRPAEGHDVVRLNPEIDFGQPGVKRIRTETIFGRWMAPEPIDEIAVDFGLEVDEVEHAIRYEVVLRNPKLALAA